MESFYFNFTQLLTTMHLFSVQLPPPDVNVLMDQFTKFGVDVSIIGAALFVLGFIFVTSLNFTAENQVTKTC